MKFLIPIKYIFFLSILLALTSCDDYLDIPIPTDSVYTDTAFENDATAAATLNGVLATLSINYYISNITLNTSLYSDELKLNYVTSQGYNRTYLNNLNVTTSPSAWSDFYPLIYQTNLIIEGLDQTDAILVNRDQYLGEAYFYRGLFFFYLTNLYGEISLPLTSDYEVNNTLSRISQDEVYVQIISDLEMAKSLLPEAYKDKDGNDDSARTRPNKSAAQALAARTYLFTEQWELAAENATAVTTQTGNYALVDPSKVFLTGSQSMIWGLTPDLSPFSFINYVADYYVFMSWLSGYNPVETDFAYAPGYLSDSQLEVFETGDNRLSSWTNPIEIDDATYFVPYKYQSKVSGEEAYAVLRIAEQYLISAEANAQLGQLTQAKNDLNKVRARAGLENTTANSKEELLDAIAKERRAELFTEGGYRFFDLNRTNTINEVMTAEMEVKNEIGNAIWAPFKAYWPIPSSEIYANPNLEQTSGY